MVVFKLVVAGLPSYSTPIEINMAQPSHLFSRFILLSVVNAVYCDTNMNCIDKLKDVYFCPFDRQGYF